MENDRPDRSGTAGLAAALADLRENEVLDIVRKRMAQGDHQPGFELAMARKDVRLMTEATAGKALAVLPGLAVRMDALLERGLGASDLGALAVDTVPRRG